MPIKDNITVAPPYNSGVYKRVISGVDNNKIALAAPFDAMNTTIFFRSSPTLNAPSHINFTCTYYYA